jgi:hypothetical protein
MSVFAIVAIPHLPAADATGQRQTAQVTSPDLEKPRPRYGWRPLVAVLTVICVVAAVAITVQLRAGGDGKAGGRTCSDTGPRGDVEVAADAPAEAADLARAATVLNQRLAVYDCHAGVTVTGDRLRVSATDSALSHLDELTSPGQLEFREVLQARPATNCAVSIRALRRIRPTDRFTACTEGGTEQLDLLPAQVLGADIAKATPQRDQYGQWQVVIAFTEAGQRRWTTLTGRLVGKRLAIVLDGVVITAPNIQERIDGDAQITGSFSETSAKALAGVVTFGALPVGLHRT